MKRKTYLVILLNILAFAFFAAAVSADPKPSGIQVQAPQLPKISGVIPHAPLDPVATGFTYQGKLNNGGSPANGQYDLQFTLYDAPTGGNQVGSPVVASNQTVSDGLFTVQLDFGPSAFQGSARWLEIAVQQTGGGGFTTLSPRQPLTPAPYALSLMPGATITGTLDASPVISVTNAGSGGTGVYGNAPTGFGLYGTSQSIGGAGVYGTNSNNIGVYGSGADGLYGTTTNAAGYGVYGSNTATNGAGIYGADTANGIGVAGTGGVFGVYGSGVNGVYGTTASAGGYGVYGTTNNGAAGVRGTTTNASSYGVWGNNSADGDGVYGTSSSGTGVYGSGTLGVYGTGGNYGVYGNSGVFGVYGNGNYGVYGNGGSYGLYGSGSTGVYGTGNNYGLYGSGGTGVYGYGSTGVYGSGGSYGLYGSATSYGVYGTSNTYGVYGNGYYGLYGTGSSYGVYATSQSTGGVGVYGNDPNNIGVFGQGPYGVYGEGTPYAGYFFGNVHATGSCCSSEQGTYQIDDPTDPANKYLNQEAVESPDSLDLYRGHVTLDSNGEATVTLPAYFQALNRDFDYQLTAIGAPAPNMYVAQEIQGNQFKIAGGKPGIKVSWQVTGTRQDPFEKDHPITTEQDKPSGEKGTYLYPKGYGQPDSKGVDYERLQELHQQAEQAQKGEQPKPPEPKPAPATPASRP